MWKILYKIDHSYLNYDNYRAVDYGNTRSAYGDTPDLAMDSLIFDLKDDGDLEGIIDSKINPDPYASSYTIDIISCEEIKLDGECPDFYSHPLFLSLLKKTKEREEKEKADVNAAMERRKVEKEKAEFERLKKIYDNG